MTSQELQVIKDTKAFVKTTLTNAEGGHDWFHTQRVLHYAIAINAVECANEFIIQLAALLHDIADSKFNNGDETIGPKTAQTFLESTCIAKEVIQHVVKIIENISYKGGYKTSSFTSKELDVVQDADRLDALGAIGIARTFNYGGFKHRPLYNPDILPNLKMSKEDYKTAKAPTLNHFYEKLFLLKDAMNTTTGKRLATKRHQFMEAFVQQFKNEWQGLV